MAYFLNSGLTFKRSYKSLLWHGGIHTSTGVSFRGIWHAVFCLNITPRDPDTLGPELNSPSLRVSHCRVTHFMGYW